jgi:WD40 repeat protein
MDQRWKTIPLRLLCNALLILLVLMGGVMPQSASAQTEPAPQKIPIAGRLFTLRIAPDGKMAAAFRVSALYEDVPDALHLPIDIIDLSAIKVVGQLRDFGDYAVDVAFTSDGKQLASYHQNGEIRLWDVATLKLTKTIRAFVGRARLFFTDNDRSLLVAMYGNPPGNVLSMNVETGAFTKQVGFEFETFKEFVDTMGKGFPTTMDYQFAIFALSTDGKTLATATLSDQIYLWDVATNTPTLAVDRIEKPRTLSFISLVFIMDSNQLVYYDLAAKKTIFWDVKANKQANVKFEGGANFAITDDALMMAWLEGSELKTWRWGDPASHTHTFALPEGFKVTGRMITLAISADKTQVILAGLGSSSDELNYVFIYPIND